MPHHYHDKKQSVVKGKKKKQSMASKAVNKGRDAASFVLGGAVNKGIDAGNFVVDNTVIEGIGAANDLATGAMGAGGAANDKLAGAVQAVHGWEPFPAPPLTPSRAETIQQHRADYARAKQLKRQEDFGDPTGTTGNWDNPVVQEPTRHPATPNFMPDHTFAAGTPAADAAGWNQNPAPTPLTSSYMPSHQVPQPFHQIPGLTKTARMNERVPEWWEGYDPVMRHKMEQLTDSLGVPTSQLTPEQMQSVGFEMPFKWPFLEKAMGINPQSMLPEDWSLRPRMTPDYTPYEAPPPLSWDALPSDKQTVVRGQRKAMRRRK